MLHDYWLVSDNFITKYYYKILLLITRRSIPNSNKVTKKSKIRELYARGGYTDEEIARLAKTSVDNVRKEKSIYLKEDGKKIILTKESTKVGTSLSGEKISNTERMS